MSSRQRLVVWLWITAVVVAIIVPPWQGSHRYISFGYRPIFTPPSGYAEIDFSRLALEWVAASVVAVGLWFAWPEIRWHPTKTRWTYSLWICGAAVGISTGLWLTFHWPFHHQRDIFDRVHEETSDKQQPKGTASFDDIQQIAPPLPSGFKPVERQPDELDKLLEQVPSKKAPSKKDLGHGWVLLDPKEVKEK